MIYAYFGDVCRDSKIRVLAMNGMADHIHLVFCLPTSLSIADAMSSIKGKSSHYISYEQGGNHVFSWQPGYGALTFGKRDLDVIVRYVVNQEQHHTSGKISSKMEITKGLDTGVSSS